MSLAVQEIDPRLLQPAPWNPNVASAEDQAKLDASLIRFGFFKPCIVRTLEDGTLQILGGHWRRDSAIRLGMPAVPVINLGTIGDDRAKEITLVDNGRYGHDDANLLADLLRDLGNAQELASFMPYDLAELDAITAATAIDLDTLGLVDDDEEIPVETTPKLTKSHQMMRFLVPIEDAERISGLVKQVQQARGFTEADQLTNAGDALVSILTEWAAAHGV